MLETYASLNTNKALLNKIESAFIVSDLGNGGQERQLYNLVKNLGGDKIKLVIPWDYCSEDRYLKLLEGEKDVIVIDLQSKGLKAKLKTTRKIIGSSQPQYFHSYTFHLNFIAWISALGLSTKAIGGVRSRLSLNRKTGGFVRFYLSLIFPYHRISNNYSCFYNLDISTKLLAKAFSKTQFVHNGIDTHRFKAAEKSINFESRPLKTISVGRLFPVKQVDQIISWVAAMKESGVDIQHEHAGKGPEMENLVAKVEKLGLEKEFIFKGNVNDVPSFMSTAQLFVHAARFEGCPNVIMEAMACGLPILSSNAGDTSFIVDHGENGYVFEIDDTEAMLSLGLEMASKPDLLATFADNGQIKAKDNFGISQYVKAVREAYSKMKISI